MGAPLKVLQLEDDLSDAILVQRELKRSGIVADYRRAESKAEFIHEILEFKPEVILSDNKLPTFDGLSALRFAREFLPNTPFIFVSGTLGEERAVQSLREGAADYVPKDRLDMLGVVFRRVMEEAGFRRNERDRFRDDQRRRLGFDHAPCALMLLDARGQIVGVNVLAAKLLGKEAADLRGRMLADLVHHEDFATEWAEFQLLTAGKKLSYELPIRLPSTEVAGRPCTVSAVRTTGVPPHVVRMVAPR